MLNVGSTVENVNLKRRYEELSKSNAYSRSTFTAKINALTAENAKLKTELKPNLSLNLANLCQRATLLETIVSSQSVNTKTPKAKHNMKTTKKVWKAKVVASVKPQWKPTGRHFTLYDKYPLTRIVEPIVEPLELTPSVSSSSKVTMISRFTDCKLSDRKAGSKGYLSVGRTVADSSTERLKRATTYRTASIRKSDTSVLEDLKALSWKTCQEGSLLNLSDHRSEELKKKDHKSFHDYSKYEHSAQAEEPVFETAYTKMLQNQRDDIGNTEDQPNVEAASKHDWFKKPKRPPTPDPDWNTRKQIDFRPPHTWISQIAKAKKPPLSFDELMSTPIDFSAFVMNHLKIDNLA
ncbi:hypothetical protein Tco_0819577 [Tanacetum coccineum]|uniref:Uncharacterized protein n=1 Tax=Tanacetum coccineum TaxID=301880 RepID=A0ABQ5AAW4_9ASTR